MLNLLPQNKKQELKNDLYSRVFISLGLVSFLILFIFAILTSTFYWRIKIQTESQKKDFNLESYSENSRKIIEKQEEIININNEIIKIKNIQDNLNNPLPLIDKISLLLPNGVNLQSLNIDLKNLSVNLSGFSTERDKLLEFETNLEKSNFAKEINVPLIYKLKKEKVDFTMDFKLY